MPDIPAHAACPASDPSGRGPARPIQALLACPAWLTGFAWLTAIGTFLLILAGGQVTSTDSGDAVPTWPFPITLPMKGGVLFELGHRQVAAGVGALTLLLLGAVWLLRARLPKAAFTAAVWAGALVFLQALVGGLRVYAGRQLGTSESPVITGIGIIHALLGQAFFCLVACTVYFLGRRAVQPAAPEPESANAPSPDRLHRSALLACGAFVLQLGLGAVLRLTRPGPVPLLVLLHLAGAAAVVFAVLETSFWLFKQDLPVKLPVKRADLFIRRLAKAQLALLGLQILLGFLAYFGVKRLAGPAAPELTWTTVIPTLHVGVGALLILSSVLLALETRTPHAGARNAAGSRLAAAAGGSI